MATGRTVDKWTRVYINGYDVSGYSRNIGPLTLEHEEADLTAMADAVRGFLANHSTVNVGTLNANFDNTATVGVHTVLNNAGGDFNVLVAKGIQAAPAAGDPAFGGVFKMGQYGVVEDAGAMTVTMPFMGWSDTASTLLYASPWGQILHANSAATAANSSTGIDNYTGGATTKGGLFIYHVTAGNGTATLSVDDSADNSSFSALSGATSGSIDCSSVQYGIVALGNSATVKQYLRWQIALGTATTVTFVSAFCRG